MAAVKFIVALALLVSSIHALDVNFYAKTCPGYSKIVKDEVQKAVSSDPTIPAGLLRMHFHDCWIRGCDASVLATSVPRSESTAGPNSSLRGVQVINNIKKAVEAKCKGVVSCADILTTAARDAVVLAGGPSWNVPLGRKDGRISRASEVNLPGPTDSVDTLISKFGAKQLTTKDLVGLSGAHTIGFGNCQFFQNRLSNDPTMDSSYARSLRTTCASASSAPNDPITRDKFDNRYYRNLQVRKGLFSSDEGLFFSSKTKGLVNLFSGNDTLFRRQFTESMTKLITLPPFQANSGSIRSNCAVIN